MSRIFGKLVDQIISKPQTKNQETQRFQSLFRKSKVAQEQLSPYIILRATKDDHRNILNLMHETYFTEEPLCYSIKLTKNPVMDECAINALAQGVSVVARCKYNGCIVGACVNESAHCWDPDMMEKLACNVRCPKVKRLLLFHAHLQRLPDIWKKYDVNKVFEMSMLFVHKHHRKRGLALRLMQESKEAAADCGFKVVRCDATNAYIAKLCERLKMRQIAEMPYASYLSRAMEPIFQPPFPHVSAKVYVDIDPQLKKTEL